MKIDRTCAGHVQSVCVHAGDVSQDTHWDAYRPQDPSPGPAIADPVSAGFDVVPREVNERPVPRFLLLTAVKRP